MDILTQELNIYFYKKKKLWIFIINIFFYKSITLN